MPEYLKLDYHTAILLIAGFIALLAAIVPVLLERKHISAPIIYLLLGAAGYLISSQYTFEPLENISTIKYITEFVVIIALTNAGLRIQEPFKWHSWRYSFRLLIIAMPITIVSAAFLGWWIVGFAPATAMLFGALISPTDPVLAAELQTSEPGKEDTSKSQLGLTSEAGLNDGLAFPFTYFAIMAATVGLNFKDWIGDWFLHHFLVRIGIGVVLGLACGWILFKLVLSISTKSTIGRISRGILSLTLTLLPYAVTEIAGGYGFIAVFFAACIFSDSEKHQEQMTSLHDFNEELESFVVALIFITSGIFIALHYEYILFDVEILTVALLLVLVVRPVAGYISLIKTKLNPFQKFVLSFYGIRGIGSIFYLAYALSEANFEQPNKLFAVTTATIFFSVLIHGISARSAQKRIKKHDFNHQHDK